MQVIRLLLTICFLLLVGCSTVYVPPVDSSSLPKQGKVALIVNVSDKPKHTHAGTTVFNNFVKSYDYNWQLESFIVDEFTSKIERKTTLKVDRLPNKYFANYVEINNKQWVFNQESEELRQQLREQGYVAVVSIIEVPSLASLECSQFGCAEHYSAGYGLFTRSFLGLDRYIGSASFHISAEIIASPVDLSKIGELSELLAYDKKNSEIEHFEDPDNFENLTEEEMNLVKKHVYNYLSRVADKMGDYFSGSFVVAGPIKSSGTRQL
jgi:hypothetical protein